MHATLRSYVIGFALSLLFTIIPYILVAQGMATRPVLIGGIVVAALLQLIVQLGFFLHVGLQPAARSRLHTFLFTAFMVVVVVAGSLWIMHDLNYFMMEPIMQQMPADHSHGHH